MFIVLFLMVLFFNIGVCYGQKWLYRRAVAREMAAEESFRVNIDQPSIEVCR
ncbi:MAG: hypothetical protein K5893_00205 [Prevotella sp.]|nr:hypothetical protein [Prevotella sp.]